MERLQDIFTERTTASARDRSAAEPIKLTKLTDNDDIESYLTTFEQIMAANEVSQERWSFQLAPQLTGKAQQAYAALPPDEAKAYDTVKEAILRQYDITGETYRQRFRKLRPNEGESPQELITRLKDRATRWARESKNRDDLQDLIVREQFLSVLPEDARIAVIERQPKNMEEAGRFASNFLQARSMSISKRGKRNGTPVNECPRCGKHGHWARDCPNQREQGSSSGNGPKNNQRPTKRPTTSRNFGTQNREVATVKCYNCNERGHYTSRCPQKASYCSQPNKEADRARRHGTINGVYCKDILVDTGATQTLIRRELVTDDDILDGEVTIRCAHGDTASYPVAAVKINIGGKDIITTAGESETLPASALLGWDIPELLEFVAGKDVSNSADALAVMTRLRRRQQEETLTREPPRQEVEASPNPIESPPETPHQESELSPEAPSDRPELPSPPNPNIVFNFDAALPLAGSPRPKQTRTQKRKGRRRYRRDNEEHVLGAVDVSPEELRTL